MIIGKCCKSGLTSLSSANRQFMTAPLSPGFNLDRYDRELRRPFPSDPQFAPDSKTWQREHGIGDTAEFAAPGHDRIRYRRPQP